MEKFYHNKPNMFLYHLLRALCRKKICDLNYVNSHFFNYNFSLRQLETSSQNATQIKDLAN